MKHWQFEEFHNNEHYVDKPEGVRYTDVDDIPDGWVSKRHAVVVEEYIHQPRTQYGSNEGGVHTDSETQKQHYIKYPAPEQARVEAATAEIYDRLGIRTVTPRVETINGKEAVVSEWDAGLKSVGRHNFEDLAKSQRHADTLALMHHAAIMTGNRDIAGMDADNIMMHKDGDLVSLDQGGALHFRAQGGIKPFDANIDDVESFRNPQYSTSNVFEGVHKHHPEAFKRAVGALKSLGDGDVSSILNKHGLSRFSDVINARKRMLIKHFS